MVDPDYVDARRQEFLAGTFSWHFEIIPGVDSEMRFEAFEKEYADPLRTLSLRGEIGKIKEHKYYLGGREWTDRVDIIRHVKVASISGAR